MSDLVVSEMSDMGISRHVGLQAIFMIPTKPPPSFRQPDKWSAEFIDFVSKCLVKNPENRATAVELLEVSKKTKAGRKLVT